MLLAQEHTVMVRQTSKWGQIFLMSLVGLGATAFSTAWFYRIDEVITVQGRLIPKEGAVEVKSPVSGQLSSILVKSGDTVREGQVLLKFDVEGASAQRKSIEKQLELEKQKIKDQIETSDNRLLTIKRNIGFTQEILRRFKPLEASGAISEIQLLQQKNRLETQNDSLLQLQAQLKELKNESNIRKEKLVANLNQLNDQLKNEEVKAPISGVVFDFKPDNSNYFASTSEILLKVVPKGELKGVVNVFNSDIGFLKEGQKVKVRVDSFPFTEYGQIDGEIANIGADALPPSPLVRQYHFPVDLDLEKSNLRTKEGIEIALQSGMTITTNLKLRDRRLIELLSDLFTNRGESLQRLRQP